MTMDIDFVDSQIHCTWSVRTAHSFAVLYSRPYAEPNTVTGFVDSQPKREIRGNSTYQNRKFVLGQQHADLGYVARSVV